MLDAIVASDSQCVSLLLQAGVDPNAPHYFGNALGIPALASCFIRHTRLINRRSRWRCAAALLAHGADAYAVFKVNNEDYTTMRLLVDARDWLNVARLLNFCDPFHQIPEKEKLENGEEVKFTLEPSYDDLFYGREGEWLLAAPVPSHNNSALKKRANANRFKI